MENEAVNDSSKTIITIMYIAVFLGVMILAVAVTLNALTSIETDTNGNVTLTSTATETGAVNSTGYTLLTSSKSGFNSPTITSLSNASDTKLATNETGAFINGTGYTLAKSTQIGFTTPVIIAIHNNTNGAVIPVGNYTLVNNKIYNTSAVNFNNVNITYTWSNVIGVGNVTVSGAGVVKNRTAVSWNNLQISYSYKWLGSTNSTTNGAIDGIKNNTLSMVANFFALMPTIGTIFAVVLLIAGIVILVVYVSRMRKPQDSEGYTG